MGNDQAMDSDEIECGPTPDLRLRVATMQESLESAVARIAKTSDELPDRLKLEQPWEIVTMTILAYTTKKVNFRQVKEWNLVQTVRDFVLAVYKGDFVIDSQEKFQNACIMKYPSMEDGRNKKAIKLFANGKMHLTGELAWGLPALSLL